MSYDATGTITAIGEIQEFGTKGFKKREVILTIPDNKYPQPVAFEFQGERVDMPDKYEVGDEVCISFDLRGREHKERVYNTLNAWRITNLGGQGGRTATSASREQKSPAPMSRQGLKETPLNPTEEDVPF